MKLKIEKGMRKMELDCVRPTKVMAYLKEKGIRIAGDAKPELMKQLNSEISLKIEEIINKLPKFTKGENKGEPKRKTIKLEDLS